ncbi:Uncharacterised protein [Mycobacteroides abscessus]|nr:Uncharacterised protein [Mycobacteroides abscessus]
MGADCKSVGLRLRRFESCTRHSGQAPSRGGLTYSHRGRVRQRAIGQAACAAAAIAHVTSGCLISLCAPLNGDSSAAMTAFASSA